MEQRAAPALPASTAAVTALVVLAAQQQALLAQPNTMAVLAQTDLPAVVVAAAVQPVDQGRVATETSTLAVMPTQTPLPEALQTHTATQVLSTDLDTVRAAVVVAEQQRERQRLAVHMVAVPVEE